MMMLPPVDPDYLIEEDDADTLHCYAAGLLAAWRGEAETARPYPRETIRAAAVWLLGQYAENRIPLSSEAATLIGEIIAPNPRQSTAPVREGNAAAYWAAIRYEAANPGCSVYATAKAIRGNTDQRAMEATLRGWRKLQHYRDNVRLYQIA